MREAKRFKNSHKASDLCETCENGKVAKGRLEKLQRELEENACTPEERLQMQEELTKLRPTVAKFETHYACKTEQRSAFKWQRTNLANGQGLLVLDFKENITIGGGPRELTAAFYNKTPRTLLGFVLYSKEADVLHKRHINIISDVLSHDAGFVIHAFKKVLQLDFVQALSSLSIWSDCGPHFRCKEFCYFLFRDLPTRCANLNHIEWNLFAERHGKSCCDSHFSLLSRWKREIETHTAINNTTTLIAEWMKKADGTSIDMQFIDVHKEQFTRDQIHTLEVDGRFKDYLRFEARGNSLFGSSSFNGAMKLIGTEEIEAVDRRVTKQAYSRATTNRTNQRVHLCQAICRSTGKQCASKGKVQLNGLYFCGTHKEGGSKFETVPAQMEIEVLDVEQPAPPVRPVRPVRPAQQTPRSVQQRRLPPVVSILSLPPRMTMVTTSLLQFRQQM